MLSIGWFLEVSMCGVASALGLKHGSASMLELSIFSCWEFCGTLLGCVSVLSIGYLFRIMLPDVNVPVSMFLSFPCRNWFPRKTGIFCMSGSVNPSFPCRNCFPGKDGVFSMPDGNSAWLMS